MGQTHVCEHVADSITRREYFTGFGVTDRDAMDQLQIGCQECEARVDSGEKAGPRWLACDGCLRALQLRRGWKGLDHLAPRPDEPFEAWHIRVDPELPDVPAEVAREWVYRHWGESPYEWMPLRDLRFKNEQWLLERVLQVAVGDCGGRDVYELRENPGDWVRAYMDKNGTWSAPIIVFDNEPEFRDHMHPLQLLEGHRRLGYLRVLVKTNRAASSHSIWVARMNP